MNDPSCSTDFSRVQKSSDTQTKVELKIPQLTLAKIAEMGRHETVSIRSEYYSPKIEGTIPVRGNFCTEIILL